MQHCVRSSLIFSCRHNGRHYAIDMKLYFIFIAQAAFAARAKTFPRPLGLAPLILS